MILFLLCFATSAAFFWDVMVRNLELEGASKSTGKTPFIFPIEATQSIFFVGQS